jgi:hypothetical protein
VKDVKLVVTVSTGTLETEKERGRTDDGHGRDGEECVDDEDGFTSLCGRIKIAKPNSQKESIISQYFFKGRTYNRSRVRCRIPMA